MRKNLGLLVMVLVTFVIALSPIFIFRGCRTWLMGKPKTSRVHNEEPIDLPEELVKGPPKVVTRLYLTQSFREHFKEHRDTLEKIVAMAREEESGIRVGFGRYTVGFPRERTNNYLALLREVKSPEWVKVQQEPFRVEVIMYCQGLCVSGMIRGFLYSPDEEPSPPIFVNDLDTGMRKHPGGWKMVYVPLEDGWYIFCDWR